MQPHTKYVSIYTANTAPPSSAGSTGTARGMQTVKEPFKGHGSQGGSPLGSPVTEILNCLVEEHDW